MRFPPPPQSIALMIDVELAFAAAVTEHAQISQNLSVEFSGFLDSVGPVLQ